MKWVRDKYGDWSGSCAGGFAIARKTASGWRWRAHTDNANTFGNEQRLSAAKAAAQAAIDAALDAAKEASK